MTKLHDEIRSIEQFCLATAKTPDKIEEKIQEYLKCYPHLHNPACVDMLREAVKTWYRIKQYEEIAEKTDDEAIRMKALTKASQLSKQWFAMLSNLGLTFTKQQYISKKNQPVMPPIDKLKLLGKPKENE